MFDGDLEEEDFMTQPLDDLYQLSRVKKGIILTDVRSVEEIPGTFRLLYDTCGAPDVCELEFQDGKTCVIDQDFKRFYEKWKKAINDEKLGLTND